MNKNNDGLKKFVVCAAVESRVYCEIYAKNFADAKARIRDGECDCADWEDEEWVSRPNVVSLTDCETGELDDSMCF